MNEARSCGRCGHPAFAHATGRCTAVDKLNAGHGDVIEDPCTCQRPYEDVAGEAQ